VHKVPASRADWRFIDGERVCAAVDALEHAGDSERWATLFAMLGEKNRLTLLLAIHAAEPISVSDLSVATGLRDTAVSQMLRRLRDLHLVSAERDGKVIRYSVSSPELHQVLHLCASEPHVAT
jgi:ArsR family transcriptional regulator, lead/cadmium/zinc/bismuth-responsive transcriptional repressor